ncbi:hypothetical protein [Nocardia anaemiae]|uniref:hypothetical protein n=1 Tax=Nocardia anaemiae TaxID=263910 RepID=UPI0007A47E28|nr:hypothetical protein [Nocardia anaemiae]
MSAPHTGISNDEQTLAVARGVLPSYVADYWSDERRWAPRVIGMLRRRMAIETFSVATIFTGPVALWIWAETALLHGRAPGALDLLC